MEMHVRLAQMLAQLLDSEFKIFNFKIGLDPLLGLIPGIGDFISFALSLYIVWVGYQMRLPQTALAEMIRNVVFDLVLGLIPVVGDVGDFFFKANKKNIEILKKYHAAPIISGELSR